MEHKIARVPSQAAFKPDLTNRSLGTCREQASCPSKKKASVLPVRRTAWLTQWEGVRDAGFRCPVCSLCCLQLGCWELDIRLYFLFVSFHRNPLCTEYLRLLAPSPLFTARITLYLFSCYCLSPFSLGLLFPGHSSLPSPGYPLSSQHRCDNTSRFYHNCISDPKEIPACYIPGW